MDRPLRTNDVRRSTIRSPSTVPSQSAFLKSQDRSLSTEAQGATIERDQWYGLGSRVDEPRAAPALLFQPRSRLSTSIMTINHSPTGCRTTTPTSLCYCGPAQRTSLPPFRWRTHYVSRRWLNPLRMRPRTNCHDVRCHAMRQDPAKGLPPRTFVISIKKSRLAASFCGFPARKGDTAFIWCGSHYRFLRVSPRDLRISVVLGSTGKVFRPESWSRSSRNPSQNLVHYSMSLNLLYCANSPGKITFRVSPPRLLLLYRATLERSPGTYKSRGGDCQGGRRTYNPSGPCPEGPSLRDISELCVQAIDSRLG